MAAFSHISFFTIEHIYIYIYIYLSIYIKYLGPCVQQRAFAARVTRVIRDGTRIFGVLKKKFLLPRILTDSPWSLVSRVHLVLHHVLKFFCKNSANRQIVSVDIDSNTSKTRSEWPRCNQAGRNAVRWQGTYGNKSAQRRYMQVRARLFDQTAEQAHVMLLQHFST